jgi:hypothetical protein
MTLVWESGITLQHPDNNDPLLDLNTQPSLDLQFATSKTLDDRVSGLPLVNHQRDASSGKSAGTYVGSDGLIKNSPANLLTYSEQFDQWDVGSNTTITTNAIAAPDGSMTADRIELPASGGTYVQQTNAITAGAEYTGSVWVKAVTPGVNNQFNLQYGGDSVSSTAFTATGDWQRISSTVTAALGGSFSINNRPDTYITDVYVWGAQLQEGALTDYIPTTTTATGAPRFDHDPVTGESLGLLIEESRTNFFLNSQPTNANWSQYNTATITDNQATGPDGVANSASLVAFPATGGTIPIIGTSASGASGTVTVSAYVRAVTNTVSIQIGTNLSYSASQSVGTSWTRISFTTSVVGTSAGLRSGDVNSVQNFYIWGAQGEIGSFPTSYIPTTSSTVTRAADVASITGSNFSSWYRQDEGTVFSNCKQAQVNTVAGATHYQFSDGTTGERFDVFGRANGGTGVKVFDGGTEVTDLFPTFTGIAANTAIKIALALKENDLAAKGFDDRSVQTDNSVTLPTVDRLTIGSGFSRSINGTISRLTYYPYRLTDTTLQEITS